MVVRPPCKRKVLGSIPKRGTSSLLCFLIGHCSSNSVGRVSLLYNLVYTSSEAKVVGSIPTWSIFFYGVILTKKRYFHLSFNTCFYDLLLIVSVLHLLSVLTFLIGSSSVGTRRIIATGGTRLETESEVRGIRPRRQSVRIPTKVGTRRIVTTGGTRPETKVRGNPLRR